MRPWWKSRRRRLPSRKLLAAVPKRWLSTQPSHKPLVRGEGGNQQQRKLSPMLP